MERQTPQAPAAEQTRLIHLAYRHGDVEDTAGRIYDRLVARYGRSVIARDLFRRADELPLEPAAEAFLERQMEQVVAQVIVIGPRWLNGIERPRDIERLEVSAALRRQTPIIPALAEDATMPSSSQLPEDIAQLALFNAAQARLDPDFETDMRRLLATLERYAPGLPARPPANTPMYGAPGGSSAPKSSKKQKPRSPLRIVAIGSVVVALLFLLVSVALTLTDASGASPSALAATPPPTATYMTTPFAAGSYFSTLRDGMPDWLTGGQCQPKSDGLHLVNSGNGCDAPDAAAAGDGDLSVTSRQISGGTDAPYGLYFREGGFAGKFYILLITSDGEWSAGKLLYQTSTPLIGWRTSSAIHTGLGASNTLEARFKGAQLTFFINGQQVGTVSDGSIPAAGTTSDPGINDGDGVFGHQGAEIVFTDYRLKPIG